MTDNNHQFWSTQPVNVGNKNSSIEPPKHILSEHIKLPKDLYFIQLSVNDVDEIYTLLTENYVEDSNSTMRLNYSKKFLEWQFTNPDQKKDYMLGVKSYEKLKGFVFATEHSLAINNKNIKVVSINFLCICKSQRNKRLAPLVIKEITRIANTHNIYQAIFTGGISLPFKLVEVQYYHRILDREALIRTGYLQDCSKNEYLNQKYKISEKSSTNYRPAKSSDLESMYFLYKEKCKTYKLYDDMDYNQFNWLLQTKEDVLYTYVEEVNNVIVSFGSFYVLNTISTQNQSVFKTAYLYYFSTKDEQKLLFALFKEASKIGCAMFNVLNIFVGADWFKDLLLQPGDGFLKYYLYNWETTPILPQDVFFMLP